MAPCGHVWKPAGMKVSFWAYGARMELELEQAVAFMSCSGAAGGLGVIECKQHAHPANPPPGRFVLRPDQPPR